MMLLTISSQRTVNAERWLLIEESGIFVVKQL